MENEKTIRIQDDLYQFVNGKWLESAVIPNDRPTVGGFSDLDIGVEKLLMNDFKEMANNEKTIPNEHLSNAVLLYKKGMNVSRRNRDGIKPIEKDLEKIKSFLTLQSFNRNLKNCVMNDYPLPFNFGVDVNMKDTKHHSLVILGPGTILPDTTYYEEAQKQTHDTLIGVYSAMAKQLLSYTDLTEEEQREYLKDTIAFDGVIAGIVKSRQEWADYVKNYNPMKLNKVTRALAPLKFRNLLNKIFEKLPDEVIVYDPRFLKEFKKLLSEETYPLYQHWAYVTYLLNHTSALSVDLRTIGNAYHRTLMGTKSDPSIEKQSYQIAGRYFSEPLGLYYGKTYFGEEAKKDVVDIVKEIIETYKKRMAKNDFLEPATKDKAILKLDKIVIKMGYPDKINSYFDKMIVNPRDSLFKAMKELGKVLKDYEFSLLYQDVDRSEWVMPGHMVNACYNPNTNDITFPAAILQAPFYSLSQSRSQNLGGIGTVIGHEISHAFDNNGAAFDENGNLFDWWTKNDMKVFKNKTKAMIKQFDGLEIGNGKVNGKLVVSENIADNGGMGVTIDIMNGMKDRNYEEYFINWAKVWCIKAKDAYTELLLRMDVHSPAVLRANIPPRNFPEWYETFHVTSKDGMYLSPNKRIIIW